jgi:excisionase family DNA binding protein
MPNNQRGVFMSDESITISEISRQYNVSIGYINQLIKRGVLTGRKVGGGQGIWLIDPESLNAWLVETGRKKPGQAEAPTRGEG